MSEIHAKPQLWRGLQFDSKLEANWAASLCMWEVDWEHHPGSIDLGNAGRYEPDFLLRNAGAWGEDILLEVKGGHDERLWKPQMIADLGTVLIGRSPWISPLDTGEYPGARWSLVDGTDYEWDLNGRGRVYRTAEQATSTHPGLKFYMAFGTRSIK